MAGLKVCLWFDNQAEEAANFYVDIFRRCGREAAVNHVSRYSGREGHMPEGTVLVAECTLDGQIVIALNGGPIFSFSPAASLVVNCKDQADIDNFWDALTADGGKPSQCGWLTDKYGFSWQIVPEALSRLMPDPVRGARVGAALMTMAKLDIAALEAAYNGG